MSRKITASFIKKSFVATIYNFDEIGRFSVIQSFLPHGGTIEITYDKQKKIEKFYVNQTFLAKWITFYEGNFRFRRESYNNDDTLLKYREYSTHIKYCEFSPNHRLMYCGSE